MLIEKYNKILANFDSLIDLDILAVCYILVKYKNSKYLKEEAYQYTTYFMKLLLIKRKIENPLSIIFKDEYLDQIDNLYKEILDSHKEEILTSYAQTSILRLLKLTVRDSGYSIFINCKDKIEQNLALKMLKNTNHISTVLNEENPESYFTLIMKNLTDLKSFKNPLVTGKTIYIWKYRLNYEDDEMETINKLSTVLYRSNIIKVIDPYSNIREPEKVKENSDDKINQ